MEVIEYVHEESIGIEERIVTILKSRLNLILLVCFSIRMTRTKFIRIRRFVPEFCNLMSVADPDIMSKTLIVPPSEEGNI